MVEGLSLPEAVKKVPGTGVGTEKMEKKWKWKRQRYTDH